MPQERERRAVQGFAHAGSRNSLEIEPDASD